MDDANKCRCPKACLGSWSPLQGDITGPGGIGSVTKALSPGEKADLTVTLQAGSYDLFCAIPGHKQLGMNVNISVK